MTSFGAWRKVSETATLLGVKIHPDPPSELPFDILHLSDLHCPTWVVRGKFTGRFHAFLDHVSELVEKGSFRPEIIAFTGDLVNSPFPVGARAYRRGVQALLDLAHRCGFTTQRAVVENRLPEAWKTLLYRRILIVPGNHDIYASGLRALKNRFVKHWLEIAAPTPDHRAALRDRLVPPKLDVGPLSLTLLDTNGPARWWASARGAVEQPLSLTRTTEPRFGVALLHGHPIQLPFLLEGLTESETSLLLENAGLLLKNLVAANVRLVLHGHRHYPGVGTMVLPPPHSAVNNNTQVGLPIVVVGAGSVTTPPKKLGYSSYNWIRIHPDFSVEVREAQKRVGDAFFSLQPTYLAEPGDFQYERVEKRVEIHRATGDVNVSIDVSGLRTTPGRSPVSHVPFGLQTGDGSHLAAYRIDRIQGGAPGTRIRWDIDKETLEVEPPQAPNYPPLSFTVSYFLHNAMALNDWEVLQLWGHDTDQDETSHQPTCATAHLKIAVAFPQEVAQNLGSESCWCEVELRNGTSRREDFPVFVSGPKATLDIPQPQAHERYRMRWSLPRLAVQSEAALRALAPIRRWQAYILEQHLGGQRSLDDVCQKIVHRIRERYPLDEVFVSLWVGSLAEAAQERSLLYLVGSDSQLSAPLSEYVLPFGSGVVGRAFRLGLMVAYDRIKADVSKADYSRDVSGVKRAVPKNFLGSVGDHNSYQNLLAVPILPTAKDLPEEVKRPAPRNVLITLSVGTREFAEDFPTWKKEHLDWLMKTVALPLEKDIYGWAKQLGRATRQNVDILARDE